MCPELTILSRPYSAKCCRAGPHCPGTFPWTVFLVPGRASHSSLGSEYKRDKGGAQTGLVPALPSYAAVGHINYHTPSSLIQESGLAGVVRLTGSRR